MKVVLHLQDNPSLKKLMPNVSKFCWGILEAGVFYRFYNPMLHCTDIHKRAPWDLQAHLTDHCETLPHDRNIDALYNLDPKFLVKFQTYQVSV